MKKHCLFTLILGLIYVLSSRAEAQLTIVDNSKSTFTIIIPNEASASVQSAAQEFQKDIALATGASLRIQNDTKEIASNYISIGATRLAKEAGISIAQMADASFRILTQKRNLYIIGPDTPDGKWTKGGGTSNGTANGVYTFLEDYLDVRWLMPGDIGRDVPLKSTFTIPAINRSETPMFKFRNLPYITRHLSGAYRDKAEAWGEHQKLGSSINLKYNHNWIETITPDLCEKHPDWFAMINGKRITPSGIHYKLETTNQEVVRYFADKAIETLKSNERPSTFSLSPSDGRGWSESLESKALYDPVPVPAGDDAVDEVESPVGHPSMSSLVLKWYHDVAQIVEREYPQGKLAGYIYSDYVYPPTKVAMKLPDNFTPMLCGIGTYGYGLYRPENRGQMERIWAAWAKVAPEDWFYYDLPNQFLRPSQSSANMQFSGNAANVAPPAPDILNFIFRNLVKAKIKGAIFYGDQAWTDSALANYLTAKMLWNPQLDANELQHEWLQRAYGARAGAAMEKFYDTLNDIVGNYYRNNKSVSYKLTDDILKDIYAAHFGELEHLFLQAKAQPATSIQKQRLQMIEDNLIVLQWRLRNAGFLKADFQSQLQRNGNQIADIIEATHADIERYPDIIPFSTSSRIPNFRRMKAKDVKLSPKLPDGKTVTAPIHADTFRIFAAKAGKITITPQMVNHGSMFAAYLLLGRNEGIIRSGIMIKDRLVEFDAGAGQDYYLYIAPRKDIGYQLLVNNAVTTKSTFDAKSGVLSLLDKNAPIYVSGETQMLRLTPNGVVIETSPTFPTLETLQLSYENLQIVNLDKNWKFYPGELSGTGCYKINYDDSGWTTLDIGNWWQMQGFQNYHGKAWYRKTVTLPEIKPGEEALLQFGAVDGNAVVFLNDKRLGSHLLASNYAGWDKPFHFDVTKIIQPGTNVIAVQVTSKSQNTGSGIQGAVNVLIGKPK